MAIITWKKWLYRLEMKCSVLCSWITEDPICFFLSAQHICYKLRCSLDARALNSDFSLHVAKAAMPVILAGGRGLHFHDYEDHVFLTTWRGKKKKKAAFFCLWIESKSEGICSSSLSCAQLGSMAPIPTMPTQGTAVSPQHGAGMGEFHLESFKVGVWHLWLHLQFKLVYFLLFSFYSTEFSACERCWIVISGDWYISFIHVTDTA